MNYKLEFRNGIKKDFISVGKQEAIKIKKYLDKFALAFCNEYEKELLKSKKIKPLKGKFKGLYRIRLRTFRVIYEKKEDYLIILVLRIGHRKSVYR
ncbi:MAG: hypothetical protein CR967_00435 [Proteobacteria bacterium]|nr:MAG: hypothetical protein CR967_00435 [Pseudomonadota bacterium]